MAPNDSTVAQCIQESGRSDKLVETRYVDETAMPSLRSQEVQCGYMVFHRHWMDLVFPNSIPKRAEITDTLEVFAGLGEYEPVSFCVRTSRDLKDLVVTSSELVSQNGERLDAPQVQIVRCVPRRFPEWEPLYEGGPMGVMNMPTYLELARPVNVAANRTIQYWLTVQVPSNAAAGTYHGGVEISHGAGRDRKLRLAVEVLPIKLAEPTVSLGFWDVDDSALRRYEADYGGGIGDVAGI